MKFRKLSYQILFVFLSVVLVTLGLTGWALTLLAQRIVTENIVRGHEALARRIAEEVELKVGDLQPILAQLADSDSVRSMDAARITRELQRFQQRFPAVATLYVADAQGRQIARSDEAPLENVVTLYGFQVARAGHTLISDVYHGPGGHPMVTLYVPITGGTSSGTSPPEHVIGVLVADITFSDVQAILEGLTLSREETAVILADNGRVVAHSRMRQLSALPMLKDPQLVEALVRAPAGVLKGYTDELGRRVIGVHVPIPRFHWGVVIQTPLHELATEVGALRRTIRVALLVGTLLAAVVGWIMAARLAEPIGDLARATERIAAGDLDATVEVRASHEVGVLAASFNHMVKALREQIAERTRAEEALRRYAERLQTLREIDQAILAAQSPEEIAQTALRHLQKLVPCARASVALFDLEAHQAQVLAIARKDETRVDVGERIPIERPAWVRDTLGAGQVRAVADLEAREDLTSVERALLAEGIRSYVNVPLIVQGELIGALNLGARHPHAFAPEHVDIAREVAGSLAVAIQHARLYRAEQQARRTAETLRDANLAFTQTLDLDVVLNTLLDYLSRFVPYDTANVMLLEGDARLVVRAARGYERWTDSEAIRTMTFDVQANPIFRRLVREQESVLIADTQQDPGWEWTTAGKHVRNWMGVPLVAGGKVIGLYSLDKAEPNFFTEEHLRTAEALAAQAAVAVQNARLFEQVRAGEAKLIQSAKLASLGEMAGGIAHELKNPLGIISANAQLLLDHPEDRRLLQQCAERIHLASRRAAQIIENLLEFARPQEEQMRLVDIHAVLEETLTLLAHQMELQGVELLRNFHPRLPQVCGNPDLLQQVFTNLILNACNAMPQGGTLEITTDVTPDGEVEIRFRDTGCGIPPEHLSRIFDPFFTTRPVGKGTGLGLSVSYSIVKQHHGTIEVESQVNQGSTFTVRLPRARKDRGAVRAMRQQQALWEGRHGESAYPGRRR